MSNLGPTKYAHHEKRNPPEIKMHFYLCFCLNVPLWSMSVANMCLSLRFYVCLNMSLCSISVSKMHFSLLSFPCLNVSVWYVCVCVKNEFQTIITCMLQCAFRSVSKMCLSLLTYLPPNMHLRPMSVSKMYFSPV